MAELNKVELLEDFKEMVIDFGEICRFCLSETNSGFTIDETCLYGESKGSDGESICSFMIKLGLIKMEDPKTFPSKVCKNCYKLIQVCYDFYETSQKSNNLLRNCYENSLNQSKEVNKKIIIKDDENQKKEDNSCNNFVTPITQEKQNESMIPINEIQSSATTKTQQTNKKPKCELLTYSCTQCSLKFKNAGALNFHYVATHSQRHYRTSIKYQCKTCMKLFSDQEKLKKHYKITHKIIETTEDLLSTTIRQITKFEKKKYFCFHCVPYKEFQHQEQLTDHLDNFHNDKSSNTLSMFTCPHCNDKFQTKVNLNKHLSIQCLPIFQKSKLPQNDVKQNSNKINSVLEVMSDVAQNEKSFKILCQKCNPPLEFTSVNDFAEHICNNHTEKKKTGWNCSECPATYSRKQTLHFHMREKHKEKNINELKCPEQYCTESFGTNRQLILHGISVHQKYFAYFHKPFKKISEPQPEEEDNKVKNFECDICQKKYIYKSSLRKHIQTSHLGKSNDSVNCPHCGKTISSNLNLKSHIEFVHEALFVSCPICKKKINFRTIGKHYKTHKTIPQLVLSKNSFLCNLCGKILKSKRSFQDHQKLHWNIRDEICDVCGHGFTTKKFLQLHKKTHEGVQRKTHRCDQCEKVFSGKHTLNRHLLTHSGKKNFICEICSKCFYTIQELNRHVRYHKKEYRFDCQLCEMRFLDKSRFRHHMMRHRNVRPHKCQFCEKMFIVRGKMNLHMATKHNFQVEDKKGVWKDPKTYVPLDDLL